MSNLVAINYDPLAAAVVKSTAATQAMTALDTTNLRATFTVPASGKVMVRLRGCVHGGTALPQLLLGVMNGATVLMRVPPEGNAGAPLATTLQMIEAIMVIPGLTPGVVISLDAAYGVETAVASTGIKYGGPDTATANSAFGAFSMEVWTTA